MGASIKTTVVQSPHSHMLVQAQLTHLQALNTFLHSHSVLTIKVRCQKATGSTLRTGQKHKMVSNKEPLSTSNERCTQHKHASQPGTAVHRCARASNTAGQHTHSSALHADKVTSAGNP